MYFLDLLYWQLQFVCKFNDLLIIVIARNNLPSSSGRFIRRGVHKAATSWAKKL